MRVGFSLVFVAFRNSLDWFPVARGRILYNSTNNNYFFPNSTCMVCIYIFSLAHSECVLAVAPPGGFAFPCVYRRGRTDHRQRDALAFCFRTERSKARKKNGKKE